LGPRLARLNRKPQPDGRGAAEDCARELFKEQLFFEQSVARTVREQQEKRLCGWSREPLKIEQSPDREMTDRARERRVVLAFLAV
jgi:hypothetical protein